MIDEQLADKRRKMMGVRAYWFDGAKLATISNSEVRRCWRNPTVGLELRAQRLRRLQTMIRQKEQHRQALLAIFGDLDGVADKSLSSSGTIRASANPWAKLFSEDV